MERTPERMVLNVALAIRRFVDDSADELTPLLFDAACRANFVHQKLYTLLAREMKIEGWLLQGLPIFYMDTATGSINTLFQLALYLSLLLDGNSRNTDVSPQVCVYFGQARADLVERAYYIWLEEFLDAKGVPYE